MASSREAEIAAVREKINTLMEELTVVVSALNEVITVTSIIEDNPEEV